uniref:Uncharacterized protein n=1 Tax=viral metagenome TaxID=1070528 RepID=A0A6M3LLW8_9ZZZZ
MTATSVLMILIGLFVIINSTNLVGVLKGDKQFNFDLNKDTDTTPTTGGGSGVKAK